jgi:hypothetical protein
MENEIITTQSVGRGFVEVNQEFVLEDKPRTKTVFKAEMHPGGIRGWIIRYKKSDNGDCEEIVPIKFNQLHADDGIKIELSTDAVSILYRKFEELRLLLEEQGIRYGEHNFAIADANELVVTDHNKTTIIRKLLDENLGEDVWEQLSRSNPDLATKLANAKLQSDRTKILSQFEAMLNNDSLAESAWQDFFEKNTWIFGYGLRYQILRVLQSQPNYGGTAVSGTGGQRGDFLTSTEAEVKFTCLVEIKKPGTQLLQNTEYRNGAWGASGDLSGAVSQVQVNCAKWEIEGSRTDQNRDYMADVYTVSPRGIVIIGKTSQLNTRDKKNSFERYRFEIRNPEIITFDELYERAKHIVGGTVQSSEIADELPF